MVFEERRNRKHQKRNLPEQPSTQVSFSSSRNRPQLLQGRNARRRQFSEPRGEPTTNPTHAYNYGMQEPITLWRLFSALLFQFSLDFFSVKFAVFKNVRIRRNGSRPSWRRLFWILFQRFFDQFNSMLLFYFLLLLFLFFLYSFSTSLYFSYSLILTLLFL